MAMRTDDNKVTSCRQLVWTLRPAILILLVSMVPATQGRPARRAFIQDGEFGIMPLGLLHQQPCPVVDCQESSIRLPCPPERRVKTTFVLNGNTCPGCLECLTQSSSSTATGTTGPAQSSPSETSTEQSTTSGRDVQSSQTDDTDRDASRRNSNNLS